MYVYVHMSICHMCVSACRDQKRAFDHLEVGVTGSCDTPNMGAELLSPGPLDEHQVILITV